MLDKRVFFEESIRIPWLMRYPPLLEAGTTRRQMMLNIDLLPTLLELAGAQIPDHVQGKSLVPIRRDAHATWRSRWVHEYFREIGWPQLSNMFALRTERYKYAVFSQGPDLFRAFTARPLLFDL